MLCTSKITLVLALALYNKLSLAIQLDPESSASIKQAASTIAYDLLKTYYVGNVTASQEGILPSPYYWWEAGAMWGGLIDYYAYTGDEAYVDVVGEAIFSQASPTNDFMMANQHFDLGNDDQGFWSLTAMSAAEENFPVPSGAPSDEWLALAVNCFNDFVPRWNTTQCGGGLKWEIFPQNKGYDYKSTIANAAFFQLSARLARYTGNQTYIEWAIKTFDWMAEVAFIDTATWQVNDGAGDMNNCAQVSQDHWSYNAAATVYGAAVMWNITQQEVWANVTKNLMDSAFTTFFGPYSNATGVMFEAQCELTETCDNDEFSFKAYLARWMGKSTIVFPQLRNQVMPLLSVSAAAAARSCSGTSGAQSGTACGTKWYVGGYDGVTGVGQELSALETIQSLLVGQAKAPGTQQGVSWPAASDDKAAFIADIFQIT